jgi:hypothetical protein
VRRKHAPSCSAAGRRHRVSVCRREGFSGPLPFSGYWGFLTTHPSPVHPVFPRTLALKCLKIQSFPYDAVSTAQCAEGSWSPPCQPGPSLISCSSATRRLRLLTKRNLEKSRLSCGRLFKSILTSPRNLWRYSLPPCHAGIPSQRLIRKPQLSEQQLPLVRSQDKDGCKRLRATRTVGASSSLDLT